MPDPLSITTGVVGLINGLLYTVQVYGSYNSSIQELRAFRDELAQYGETWDDVNIYVDRLLNDGTISNYSVGRFDTITRRACHLLREAEHAVEEFSEEERGVEAFQENWWGLIALCCPLPQRRTRWMVFIHSDTIRLFRSRLSTATASLQIWLHCLSHSTDLTATNVVDTGRQLHERLNQSKWEQEREERRTNRRHIDVSWWDEALNTSPNRQSSPVDRAVEQYAAMVSRADTDGMHHTRNDSPVSSVTDDSHGSDSIHRRYKDMRRQLRQVNEDNIRLRKDLNAATQNNRQHRTIRDSDKPVSHSSTEKAYQTWSRAAVVHHDPPQVAAAQAGMRQHVRRDPKPVADLAASRFFTATQRDMPSTRTMTVVPRPDMAVPRPQNDHGSNAQMRTIASIPSDYVRGSGDHHVAYNNDAQYTRKRSASTRSDERRSRSSSHRPDSGYGSDSTSSRTARKTRGSSQGRTFNPEQASAPIRQPPVTYLRYEDKVLDMSAQIRYGNSAFADEGLASSEDELRAYDRTRRRGRRREEAFAVAG